MSFGQAGLSEGEVQAQDASNWEQVCAVHPYTDHRGDDLKEPVHVAGAAGDVKALMAMPPLTNIVDAVHCCRACGSTCLSSHYILACHQHLLALVLLAPHTHTCHCTHMHICVRTK